jgi:hypothetical protein
LRRSRRWTVGKVSRTVDEHGDEHWSEADGVD